VELVGIFGWIMASNLWYWVFFVSYPWSMPAGRLCFCQGF